MYTATQPVSKIPVCFVAPSRWRSCYAYVDYSLYGSAVLQSLSTLTCTRWMEKQKTKPHHNSENTTTRSRTPYTGKTAYTVSPAW